MSMRIMRIAIVGLAFAVFRAPGETLVYDDLVGVDTSNASFWTVTSHSGVTVHTSTYVGGACDARQTEAATPVGTSNFDSRNCTQDTDEWDVRRDRLGFYMIVR